MANVVYFVLNRQAGALKIGTTNNLARRLGSLQNGSPVALEVLGTIEGGTRTEAMLHQRFGQLRMVGEWFRFEGALVQYVNTVLDIDSSGDPTGTTPPAQTVVGGTVSIRHVARTTGLSSTVAWRRVRALEALHGGVLVDVGMHSKRVNLARLVALST